jgi:hypothetical protein
MGIINLACSQVLPRIRGKVIPIEVKKNKPSVHKCGSVYQIGLNIRHAKLVQIAD